MQDDERRPAAHALLTAATRKLLELRDDPGWREHLPARCPPVLWFGDSRPGRLCVLTLAANPSRKEYLHDSAAEAVQKVGQTGDESLLAYLEPPRNRFRVLRPNETLSDILQIEPLQDEITASYDNYFKRNPYTTWFGSPRERSYNVEGFLRGLGCSYYDHSETTYRAVHIDLFPFATLVDFNRLRYLADKDLFQTGWAQQVITKMLMLFEPVAVLVFGRANFDAFGTYIDPSVHRFQSLRYQRGHFFFGVAEELNVPVVGLSTNLGNPMGFSSDSLLAYGQYVREHTGYFDLPAPLRR